MQDEAWKEVIEKLFADFLGGEIIKQLAFCSMSHYFLISFLA